MYDMTKRMKIPAIINSSFLFLVIISVLFSLNKLFPHRTSLFNKLCKAYIGLLDDSYRTSKHLTPWRFSIYLDVKISFKGFEYYTVFVNPTFMEISSKNEYSFSLLTVPQ